MKKISEENLKVFLLSIFFYIVIWIFILESLSNSFWLMLFVILTLILVLIELFLIIEIEPGAIKLEEYINRRIKYLDVERHNCDDYKKGLITKETYKQILDKELTIIEQIESEIKEANIEELQKLEEDLISLNNQIKMTKQKTYDYTEKNGN